MQPPLLVRAPGRVNLIGEHTDYNDGFVLPAAINLEIYIEVARRIDGRVEIELGDTGEIGSFELDESREPNGSWLDYVAGVATMLVSAGIRVGGFSGRLTSTLPVSAGLSSSAALEMASAWALMMAAGGDDEPVDRMLLARLCQRAENEYVGVQSGLMDQAASSCGVAGCALLLDCRSREFRPVPLPPDLALVIVDTGSRRRLASTEYNRRRSECERGVAILREHGEPVESLRDATVDMLDRARPILGATVYQRCRHVVDENARTLATAIALETGDFAKLGLLFAASHASLRDLYEVSSAALDAAVEIATSTPGVVAARMTGAGFGGCTINLVEPDSVPRFQGAIEREFPVRMDLKPVVYQVAAVEGAGVVAPVMVR